MDVVVIDNGSDTCKLGIAGEDAPRSYFPSIVAKPTEDLSLEYNSLATYIGDNALKKKHQEDYTISRPVEYRLITSWEDMEHLWRFCFDSELRIDPENQPILLTEAPLADKPNREKMIYTMFEEFKVPAFYVSVQATLALYASGRTTGVVFDCGHDITHSVSISDGYVMPLAVCSVDFGGANLTNYLQSFLQEKEIYLENEIVRDIKEKLCYVASDYYAEIETNSSKHVEYTLPDGNVVQLDNKDLCKCPETLFHQLNYEKEHFKNIYGLVHDSIQKCDVDIIKDLYQNIVLSGGSTLFKGFSERMKKEIQELAPAKIFAKVVAPPERKFSVWIGGSILASLTAFQSIWVSKEDYEEHGPSIVHRKCF